MAKVMLVEDDNNLREIYQLRLQAEGYEIVTAKDGEEALVVAKAEKPDLIISDVMMPKISGFEMLDILRNTDGLKAVKIIMLTALGQNDDQARADKLGADRYLVKSQVTLEDIAKTAHELLEDDAKAADAVLPAAASAEATPAPTPVAPTQVQAAPVAPAPTPVAAAPAPAPVAEPVATPVATPPAAADATPPATQAAPADPAPTVPATTDAAATASSAQTTAQEEADVEANIENFIAGATTDATPPAAGPNTTPAPTPTPEVSPTPPEATDAAPVAPTQETPEQVAADNDKLVASAVDALTASADKEAAPVSTQAPTVPATPPVAAAAAAPPPATPPVANDTGKTEQVPIANKKVITPIDSGPKRDINTLLALEQAKEAANQPAPPPIAVIATNENGAEKQPLMAPAQSGLPPAAPANTQGENSPPPDPNSIAL